MWRVLYSQLISHLSDSGGRQNNACPLGTAGVVLSYLTARCLTTGCNTNDIREPVEASPFTLPLMKGSHGGRQQCPM